MQDPEAAPPAVPARAVAGERTGDSDSATPRIRAHDSLMGIKDARVTRGVR